MFYKNLLHACNAHFILTPGHRRPSVPYSCSETEKKNDQSSADETWKPFDQASSYTGKKHKKQQKQPLQPFCTNVIKIINR